MPHYSIEPIILYVSCCVLFVTLFNNDNVIGNVVSAFTIHYYFSVVDYNGRNNNNKNNKINNIEHQRRCQRFSLLASVLNNDEKQQQQRQTTTSIQETSSLPCTTVPLARHTFAGMVEQRMIEKFGGEEGPIQRIIQSWRLLEQDYIHDVYVGDKSIITENEEEEQQPLMRQYCHSYVPGLTIKPFWDVTKFNWCTKLQSKYQRIRDEFHSVTNDVSKLQELGNNIWAGALNDDASSYGIGWKTLVLMDRGVWDPINVNLFPITSKIILDAKIPCTEIFFASMEPQSSIKVHSDFTNFVLTCHLGIQIPDNGMNKCRLTVGNETQQWYNGQVKLFDTSLLHDAVNDSTGTRYILMLRVWHPDLTDIERQALQFTYNCLDNPALITNYDNIAERERIEQAIQLQMRFPLIHNPTNTKVGFGSGGTNKQKSSTRKKKK